MYGNLANSSRSDDMTLGRPFKAGTTSNSTIASRQRRLNHDDSSDREQALKDLPKLIRRYATKFEVTCFALATTLNGVITGYTDFECGLPFFATLTL